MAGGGVPQQPKNQPTGLFLRGIIISTNLQSISRIAVTNLVLRALNISILGYNLYVLDPNVHNPTEGMISRSMTKMYNDTPWFDLNGSI